MTFLVYLFLLFMSVVGLCEIIHFFSLAIFDSKKLKNKFMFCLLKEDSAELELHFVYEQYSWLGRKYADKIYADRHNGTTISIYVSDAQHSQNVSVVLNGNRYNAQATDKTHFTVHLHDIKRSKKYLADVYDGNDLIGKIEISVKGKTATVNDDFDDLF